MNAISASSAKIGGAAGVVLRGPGGSAELTADEARSLAAEIETRHAGLAADLRDAADAVDRLTGFDGPLGEPCDEIASRPGHLGQARSMLAGT